jgi:iron complex transport system substrate-binding protein
MRTRHGWLARPAAFMLCLVCGVVVAIVLIEALRHASGSGQSQRAEVSAPVAERATVPFPRVVSDASGAPLVIPRQPQRIVSQTLGTDEILLAICDPQRIVALSALVDDATYSNVTEQAWQVTGRANAGAEQILHFQPDMIFVASYSKADLVALLAAAHAPVFRFGYFDHLDDIKLNIRTIGYIIGEDDKAEALVQHMERDIARARASIPHGAPPIRVMLYGQAGYTGGAHTTFDDMVQAVGAINVAAAHGIRGFRKISSEQLIQWNPEVIITSANRDTPDDMRRQLLHDPAVAVTTAGKNQRIIVLPNHIFLTVTHHIARGIEQLARELYHPES